MLVLDTNVILEMMKVEPDPVVIAWLDAQASDSVWTTSISVFEISFGLNSLPERKRKRGLQEAFEAIDYERRGGIGNLPRAHYPTNASGETRIKFRAGTLSLQLWPSKSGFVPLNSKFDEQKLALPAEYTFYFEHGERLAGKVVDVLGNPISNAAFQVNTRRSVELNERAQQSAPPAQCSGWLAEGEQAAKTNAQGGWEIQNAPSFASNPELKFELLIDHPDFAGDRRWGDYLLFHVWASWCAPCLASMPQLKADIANLAQGPFIAIGINVDADKNRGQALTENLSLDWSQNYVGEDSDFARQLAVSSVPAYYLIGPDGKLVGSSSEWTEIYQLLREKLRY